VLTETMGLIGCSRRYPYETLLQTGI